MLNKMCRIRSAFLPLILLINTIINIEAQNSRDLRTSMDNYSNLFILGRRLSWFTSEDISQMYKKNIKLKSAQSIISNATKFYCDTKNGPGHRSLIPPNSVNQLKPGDIDIIASIGDSLTAGNGAISTQALHLGNEHRDISWIGGGRANWRKYFTLPNILKEFNPNLYGFSNSRSLTIDRGSKFNLAEPMLMSPDMPFQARVLINRMKSDPKVNMEKHWKLLTIFVGNTDFCTDSCHYTSYEEWATMHVKDLIKALRILRDNIPRMIINLVSIPNFVNLLDLTDVPFLCYAVQRFGCSCLFNSHINVNDKKRALKLWYEADAKVADMNEFHTQNFTVVVQPFFQTFKLPKTSIGKIDMKYFASDCFHFSQLGHAMCAKTIWNNMLQAVGKKDATIIYEKDIFLCPTAEQPYIATRENSGYNSSLLNYKQESHKFQNNY